VTEYRKRVGELYDTVEAWIKERSPKASTRRTPIEVEERMPGPYKIDSLEIEDPALKRVVWLRPKGCNVVGAEGVVEVGSDLSHETLVYVSEAGPAMTMQIGSAGRSRKEPKANELHKESAPGWIWLQNRLIKLSPTLNDDLMHRLVEVLGR
jgi:hypothetical protein